MGDKNPNTEYGISTSKGQNGLKSFYEYIFVELCNFYLLKSTFLTVLFSSNQQKVGRMDSRREHQYYSPFSIIIPNIKVEICLGRILKFTAWYYKLVMKCRKASLMDV